MHAELVLLLPAQACLKGSVVPGIGLGKRKVLQWK